MRKKKRLKNAPLILVHLEVNWSELPDSNIFTPDELRDFHKLMSAIGLPDKETLTDSFHQLQITQANPAIVPSTMVRHIFSNGASDCQVEVTKTKLVIKQAHYEGIEKLIELTDKVIDALRKVPDIGSSVVELVSLHHVDMFIPRVGRALSEYLKPENLISYKPDISDALSVRSTTSSVSLLEQFEEKVRDISLRFNVQSFKNGQLSYVIPAELQEPNPKATMPLSIPKVDADPNGEYGIMDIRHAVKYFKRPSFSTFDHIAQLDQLYQTSSDVFWDILSEVALTEWEVELYDV